jgi:hypothetical protein
MYACSGPDVSSSTATFLGEGFLCLYLLGMNGGRDRTRTCDLLRVNWPVVYEAVSGDDREWHRSS